MKPQKRPFPTFILWLLLFAGILLWLLWRYALPDTNQEPPTITFSAGTEQMAWVMEKDQWNGTAYDHIGIFDSYERAGLLPSQAAANAVVTVRLGGNRPDEAVLETYRFVPGGASAYGQAEQTDVYSLYFSGKSATFTLPAEAGVCGFRLTCRWGGNECEYGIVVQLTP